MKEYFWLFTCFLFCLFAVGKARSELTLKQVVKGANQARENLEIRSGEVYLTASGHNAPIRTLAEAQKWLEEEKAKLQEDINNQAKLGLPQSAQERMYEIRSEMFAEMFQMDVDGRQFDLEKQVAFELQRPERGRGGKTVNIQCRLAHVDREPQDLSKPYRLPDYMISVFDGKTDASVFEHRHSPWNVDDVRSMPESIYFDNIHLWGHGFFSIPSETAQLQGHEEIDNVNCYIVKFEVIDLRFAFANMPTQVKYWIAPEYGFRTLKEEYALQEKDHEPTMFKTVKHLNYRQFSGVWYPTMREFVEYFSRGSRKGKIESETLFTIKDAVFNVNFPADFYTVWEPREEEY